VAALREHLGAGLGGAVGDQRRVGGVRVVSVTHGVAPWNSSSVSAADARRGIEMNELRCAEGFARCGRQGLLDALRAQALAEGGVFAALAQQGGQRRGRVRA
jgi:hypothetical protein